MFKKNDENEDTGKRSQLQAELMTVSDVEQEKWSPSRVLDTLLEGLEEHTVMKKALKEN